MQILFACCFNHSFSCLETDLLAAEEAANKSSIKNVIKSQLGKLSVTRTANVSFVVTATFIPMFKRVCYRY